MCSAPTDFTNQTAIAEANAACNITVPGGQSDAWLTPSPECRWGGVACNNFENVIRIDFGKQPTHKRKSVDVCRDVIPSES